MDLSRGNRMPGILDLIVEKERCDKRSEEIDALLRNEYGNTIEGLFKETWNEYYKSTVQSGYIEKYSLINSKIVLAFHLWYDDSETIGIEFSSASLILKEENRMKQEILEGLKKREEKRKSEEDVRKEAVRQEELDELARLSQKYKGVDITDLL